jgi:hypothetical protein
MELRDGWLEAHNVWLEAHNVGYQLWTLNKMVAELLVIAGMP